MLGRVSRLCRKKIQETGSGRRYDDHAPEVTNLDSLLHDIYLNYIALDDEDFRLYYRVVQEVFLQMHRAMKRTNSYYKKYSSTVQYAGSHADNLRISKPDEFDIDICIGLPLNIKQDPNDPAESDFILEPQYPGYVQLKMGVQYERIPQRFRSELQANSAPSRWGDKKLYLQRCKFMDWFKSVIDKALNKFRYDNESLPVFVVDGYEYTVRKSESGSAVTLYIEDDEGFKLDVDLVPALRFPVERWPICSKYRPIPNWWCYPRKRGRRSKRQKTSAPQTYKHHDHFMVVSKPYKRGRNPHVEKRSWRLAMQDQERMLMHDTNNMRQAIRFMKKFRDAQGMKHIVSYYIKTMFFWEAMQHYEDREFWDNSPAFLFEYMLEKFWSYLVHGKLPHFWNRSDNLLEHIPSSILKGYARKVEKLLDVLKEPARYEEVAEFLLTEEEFEEYSRYSYY